MSWIDFIQGMYFFGGVKMSDTEYMKLAIKLAKKGAGYVNPNPMVGAVIVKDNRIIGQGYHEIFGGLHAERNALKNCRESPVGATLYVTLEPCCHYGKTPPCTEAIIKSGITRVVVGTLDCNPMSESLANRLMLSPMVEDNTDNHETAFTVSIDYKDTTTGISAEERGLTARMCVTENVNPFDFRRPGHMFPLIAKNGGALERNGHTEATVDLLRLAGLKECGLCCEIMNENGKMMRTPDLIQFSQTHHIPTLTIKELQEYRKVYDLLVECVSVVEMPTKYGNFKAHCYINKLNGEHHVALVMGDFLSV